MGAVSNSVSESQNLTVSENTLKEVDSTYEANSSLTPELVIALCGPIGSPLHETSDQIGKILNDYGYSTIQIRLSELIRLNAKLVNVDIDKSTRYSEINTLINAGDALRKAHGNDVLAKLAIAKIGADRTKKYGGFSDKANESIIESGKQIKTQEVASLDWTIFPIS